MCIRDRGNNTAGYNGENGEDYLNLIETLNKEKILNLKVSISEYIEWLDSNGDYNNWLRIYLEE